MPQEPQWTQSKTGEDSLAQELLIAKQNTPYDYPSYGTYKGNMERGKSLPLLNRNAYRNLQRLKGSKMEMV